MGILDFLTGTKRPIAGTPILAKEKVVTEILALNRETAPYQIREGSKEGADLIAEWKIVDAKWYQIFAKAGLKETFKIYLKFHPEKNEVRAIDKKYGVSWQAGIPNISLAASAFIGQQNSISFGVAYAFKENLEFGKVYEYHFNTEELKAPLRKVITDSGWVYKGVVPPQSL